MDGLLLFAPVYVPGAISTVSQYTNALIPSWIVQQ